MLYRMHDMYDKIRLAVIGASRAGIYDVYET